MLSRQVHTILILPCVLLTILLVQAPAAAAGEAMLPTLAIQPASSSMLAVAGAVLFHLLSRHIRKRQP